MMSVGIYIYKQTDNLAESEPRMTSDWKGFQGGQLFEVPLHDNDQQYRTIPTGLVRVQEDRMSQGFVNWIKPSADPAFPPISYPENASYVAINGCPLSFSVHRTYYIGEVSEYFLHSEAAAFPYKCNNFNVKMECSGGAETASPEDSDPQVILLPMPVPHGADMKMPCAAPRDANTFTIRCAAAYDADILTDTLC